MGGFSRIAADKKLAEAQGAPESQLAQRLTDAERAAIDERLASFPVKAPDGIKPDWWRQRREEAKDEWGSCAESALDLMARALANAQIPDTSYDKIDTVDPIAIFVPPRVRPINRDTVDRLKESIRAIGIKVPLSVRFVRDEGEEYPHLELVTGAHRLQAAIELGIDVPVRGERGTEFDAKLWEIAENLHRAELSALQRAEHLRDWEKLIAQRDQEAAAKRAQLAQVSSKGGRGKRGGASETARALGVSRRDVERSRAIADLPEETKAAAVEFGLDDNQSALLKAAKGATPEEQIDALRDHAAPKPAVDGAKDTWDAATDKLVEPAVVDVSDVSHNGDALMDLTDQALAVFLPARAMSAMYARDDRLNAVRRLARRLDVWIDRKSIEVRSAGVGLQHLENLVAEVIELANQVTADTRPPTGWRRAVARRFLAALDLPPDQLIETDIAPSSPIAAPPPVPLAITPELVAEIDREIASMPLAARSPAAPIAEPVPLIPIDLEAVRAALRAEADVNAAYKRLAARLDTGTAGLRQILDKTIGHPTLHQKRREVLRDYLAERAAI